ncbi:MAG: tRNA preQ1(34) S-adenosylmethionine ribosyltransferase-isomerase QueA [Sedimentisphaerales bacterium]
MRTEKLNYHLPSELVAQTPLSVRSDSRLLVLDRSNGNVSDSRFSSLGEFLSPGDCLVLNDTKVLPARFFARRTTGGKLEGLFLAADADGVWTAYLKGIRKLKPGDEFYLKDRQKADFCKAVMLEKTSQGRCRLQIKINADAQAVLDEIGFPPLPPYIKRDDNPAIAAEDELRYQTVYARQSGAIAAPTAGLHFTEPLIEQLKQAGIKFAFITLHVGAGTFKPVTADNLEDHQIHKERFSIDEKNAGIINMAKNKGGRIIPVGTTSTRVLETVATGSQACPERSRGIEATTGTTDLFIMPDYRFKMIDAMITNFHLPKSTLLALVAAFAGLENILAAYNHAIEQRYRFYSYGDAMLII